MMLQSSIHNRNVQRSQKGRTPHNWYISRPRSSCNASKKPSVFSAEDKAVSSLVETGLRGSLSMAAAYALHINLFANSHVEVHSVVMGLELAVPCIAMEASLLLLDSSLSERDVRSARTVVPSEQSTAPSAASLSPAAAQPAGRRLVSPAAAALNNMRAAFRKAVDLVYCHNIRYSLVGTLPPGQRMLLEAAGQLSDDLLARGVLLGCSAAWLSARLLEAGVCDDGSHLSSCGNSMEWLAAAGICVLIASRYSSHSTQQIAATRAQREAAAAEAAARQLLLRYEPLAVQQAAAAAIDDAQKQTGAASTTSEAAAGLVSGWLGLRYVMGQASMFAAYILAGDNLLAPFTTGMAMLLVSNACCLQYMKRSGL